MKKIAWLSVALMSVALVSTVLIMDRTAEVAAADWKKDSSALIVLNRKLSGRVVDHTANHGTDNRIWSRALGTRRDLYVYVPPKFDPNCRYPVVIFMHGFGQDEQLFLHMVQMIDAEIAACRMPPVIIAAPDGSLTGEPSYCQPGSFFLNTNAGDFEDWILQDVWDFVTTKYPIRHEREAHVLAGVSMGGFAAMNLGIRHRYAFGMVVALHPPLNLRWMDLHEDYWAKFDPRCWGWRYKLDNPHEVIAKFGPVRLRIGQFIQPLYGFGDEALQQMALNNPIELIDRTGLKNGDLQIFVGYGGKDQFNIGAQAESFLYMAKCRGIGVAVVYEPEGRHDMITASRFLPTMMEWVSPRLAPYAPGKGGCCK